LHPYLFSIGSLHFPTYGTLLVLAICTAVYTIIRLGRREGFDPGLLLDFTTWLLLVALAGAKVLMIVSDWSSYGGDLRRIFSLSTFLAGGVFYGGFLAAAFFAVWYTRVHRLPFLKIADIYSPAIALGLSVGRLGCFAGGCDYGRPTTSSWGVVFTDPRAHELSGVPIGVRIYPTQILESLASLAIFGILMWRFRRKRRDGEVFLLYMSLYALARFFLEFLRGDEDRGFVFNHLFSTSQFIAILTLLAALGLAVYMRFGSPVVPEGARLQGERGDADDKAVATRARPASPVAARPSKGPEH
jgi:phosphatidylglycerol:prolipoprotein diacylglycerol transferase